MAPQAHLSSAVAPVEGHLRLPSGADAYTCTWPGARGPETQGRPPVVLLHGFGEHCRRYDELAASLALRGFTVRAMDLPGHGRSSGRRGDVGSLEGALADVQAFFDIAVGAQARDGFVFGHSMGGALAAAFAARAFRTRASGEGEPPAVRGLVLSAAAVHVAFRPAAQVRLARWLGRAWPLAPVAKVDASTISSQPEEQAAYLNDPLVRPRTPVCAALLMHDAGRVALDAGAQVKAPVLLLHGEDDPLVPPYASLRLQAALTGATTDLVTFAGCRHEVHHDHRRGELAGTVARWLASLC